MENREFDIFTDMLANKDMTLGLLTEVGMKASNTSLQNKDKYRNNEWVREQFTDSLGNFDEKKFNTFYDNAKLSYNSLAILDLSTNLTDEPVWHRDNIFVNPEKTHNGPEFKDITVSNPYQITSNLVQLGEIVLRTKSIDEIALENQVLLNPIEAAKDPSKAQWGEDPNHSFWDYFGNTLVLALYDEDGTHKDPITGEDIEHHKGDLKLNSDGNFYYEKLDGRDVHDRRVLNKMNVLTVDGSWANRHLDFFDSDDLNLKSAGGSIMKNAALVGSMFIPGVGPWVIGASIASLLVGLLGTIGKMSMGSDNALFNEMEGWSKSVSRQASSEYSQQHMLSTENMINLVGDTVALLAELRFIFKQLPSVLGKTNITTDAGIAKKEADLLAKQTALNNARAEEILKSGDLKGIKKIAESLRNSKVIKSLVNAAMDDYTKGYYKVGEVLSKGYMTAITVADTYGDAKAAGASDLEATLLTLGHAMGEYAILNTGLGELILPELRTSARRQEAIAKGLTLLARESFAKAKGSTSQVARHLYAQKLFDFGKEIAQGKYVTGTRTFLSVGAAALGESFEEVSEELLSDFSKGCYDAVKWLQGDSTRINTFGYDFLKGEFDSLEVLTRYGMNALGGFIGGGIANAATDFRSMKALDKMTNESVMLQLIYMDRNGEMKDFLKNVDKMNLGNKYLSTKFEVKDDGTRVYGVGTEEDNQDLFIKNAVKQLAQMIHEIMHANGADISDNEFISKNTFGDLRFNALLKSVTADNYITTFNTKVSEVVRLTNELNDLRLSLVDTNKNGVLEDREKRAANADEKSKEKTDTSVQTEKNIKDLEKLLKDAQKELQELTDGSKSYDFISEALFEMTDELSGNFDTVTFVQYVEKKTGLKYNKVPDALKEKYRKDYEKWRGSALKERINYVAAIFRAMSESSSAVILKHGLEYAKLDTEVQEISKAIQAFNDVLSNERDDVDGFLEEAADIASKTLNYFNFEAYMLKSFGTEEEINQYNEILSRPLAGTDMELKTQKLLNEIEMQNLALNVMLRSVSDFVNPIILRGYVGEESRKRITDFLGDLYNKTLSKRVLEMQKADVTAQVLIGELYSKVADQIIQAKNKIEKLANTPFELGYNEFSVAVGAKLYNISELILELNLRLLDVSDNVSNFKLDSDLELALRYSIQTLKMYRASIMAARTDSEATGSLNVFGYNATLNEVAGKIQGDNHPQLAEIDSKIADKMVVDIDTNLSKLDYLRRLFNVNTGQKLTLQDRVAANRDMLTYRQMRTLVGVKDDDELRKWKGFSTFEQTMNSLATLSKLESGELNTSLKAEDKKKVQTEVILMENAFYDLIHENFGDFKNFTKDDVTELKLLINPTRFALYSNADEILNENLTAIDGNSFIWTLAARSALRSSDFYKAYAEVIDPTALNPIAPISPLEMAIYNDYANIVNGNVFAAFAQAYKESVVEDFLSKSTSDLVKILKDLGFDDKTALLSTSKEWLKYVVNNLPVPKYKNIVLTEGIPGAGKTKGTFVTLVNILKKYHKDDVLKNVWVVHGVGLKNAEGLVTDIGLEVNDNTRAFSREALMNEIDSTWLEYDKDPVTGLYIIKGSDYTVSKDGRFVSSRPVNFNGTPPSLIVIDEVTHFTSYDLDLILKFAQLYGITVIVAGDYDLSGVTGYHNVKELDNAVWWLNTKRTDFIRSPKLGVSMRTDNSLKSINLQKFLDYMHNTNGTLSLDFYQGEDGIYGDKVVAFNGDYYDPTEHREDALESVLESLEIMKKTLKKDKNGNTQKIGYIFNDTTSPIYQELSKEEWEPYIELKPGFSAQGGESQYYIVDINPYKMDEDSDELVESMNYDEYLKLLYTGITRSEQGSIVIAPPEYLGFKIAPAVSDYKISEPKNADLIKKYATSRKELLTELSADGLDIKIIPRVDSGTTEELAASPIVEKGLNDGVNVDGEGKPEPSYNPPPQVDNNADDSEQRKQAEELLAKNPTKEGDKLTILMVWGDEKDTYEKTVLSVTADTVTYTDGTSDSRDILLSEFGLPYTKDEATYTIIKHSARVVEVPSDPVNAQHEITIVTDDDLKTNQKVAEEIDKTNEDDPKTPINDEDGIDMLLHTHNTFETGLVWLSDDPTSKDYNKFEWDEYNEARIDSLNGLIKLGRTIDRFKGRTRSEYLSLLGGIRSILFNTKEKDELLKKLAILLRLPKVFVTFAYKSTPRPGEGNKASGRRHVSENKDYFELEKDINEHTEFNGSTNPENSEWHNKSLVAIINNGTEDVLEIPLAAFTSPWTLLLTRKLTDKGTYEPVFKEVLDKFTEYRKLGLDYHAISGKLQEDFKDDKRKSYRELMDLLELFDFTDGGVFFIEDLDWTLARDCSLVGPKFSRTRGYYYDDDSKKKYDWNKETEAEWVTLSKFAKRNNARISNGVYTSRFGEMTGVNHKVLKKGHSFVFYTNDLDLNTDEKMYKQFKLLELKKEAGEPYDPKVILLYVMPPLASFLEYIENLHHIMHEHQTDDALHIGLPFTSYKIVKKLINNPRFLENLEKRVPGITKTLQQTVTDLIKKEDNPTEFVEAMKTATVWEGFNGGKDPKPLKLCRLFDGVLLDACYKRREIKKDPSFELNTDMVLEITKLLAGDGINGIRRRLPITRSSDTLEDLIKVNLEPGYEIDGLAIKVHGKVDSYLFLAHMGDLVHTWLATKKYVAEDGHSRSYDTKAYINRNSRLEAKKGSDRPGPDPYARYVKYLKAKTGVDYSDIFKKNNFLIALATICNHINATGKLIAVTLDKEVKVFDVAGYRATFKSSSGAFITDITSTRDTNGISRFVMELEDITTGEVTLWNAEVNEKGELTRSPIIKAAPAEDPKTDPATDDPAVVLINIDGLTPDNFGEWAANLGNVATRTGYGVFARMYSLATDYDSFVSYLNSGVPYSTPKAIKLMIDKFKKKLTDPKDIETLDKLSKLVDMYEENRDNPHCALNIKTVS